MGIFEFITKKKENRELRENYNIIVKAYTRGKKTIEEEDVYEIIMEGEKQQNMYYHSIIERDFNAMLEQNVTLEEIKKYFSDPFLE